MIDESDVLTCLGADEDLAAGDGTVMPPLVNASLFRKSSVRELREALKNEDAEYVYTRGNNPTLRAFETRLAQLERGEACRCFGSGMAAISSVFTGLLSSGDHVLFVNNIYNPTLQFAEHMSRFGISHDRIPAAQSHEIKEHIKPNTRLIYFESPGTMLFELVPIGHIVSVARSRDIYTCIDNTAATPLFQKPIQMGVDLVVHSCTKYIGGHSDVVGGAIVTSERLMKRIFRDAYMLFGGIQSPFDAWLLIRGLMTLPTRLRQHQSDGLQVAKFLQQHEKVKRVFHPNLPETGLFRKQMNGYTGLFSVELDVSGFDELADIVDRLSLFGKAVSWGGAESLIIPHFGHEHGDPGDEIPAGLVRLSVGLEGAHSLIADLEQALA